MLVNIKNAGQVINHYNGRCLEERSIAITTSLSGSSHVGLLCEQRYIIYITTSKFNSSSYFIFHSFATHVFSTHSSS